MSQTLPVLGAIAVTALVTWFLARSFFTKGVILPNDYQAVKDLAGKLQRELDVKTELYNQSVTDCNRERARAEDTQEKLRHESQQLSKALAECEAATQNWTEAKSSRKQDIENLETKKAELHEALIALENLKTENKSCLEKIEEQKLFLAESKSSMEAIFKTIAQDTLSENSRQISAQQKEKLEDTLLPFREQIEAFRRQVDEKFTAEVADRNTLKGELSKVFALTNNLTDQTNKLSNALTSNTKMQGNYGEDILLTILQNAGMVEDVHFHKQYNTKNEEGQRIIPDIIINCPDNYSLVVDSKVSLVHYIRYCNEAATPEDEKALRKDIYLSFKAHIDGLSGKKYESIAHCADFVLMFAPIESAFTVAAQHDSDIRNYAFGKKVFLVTPSNLLLVVKMIGDLWQKDRINKEAEAMADRARRLYEKACGFLDSFESMGSSLEKAQEHFRKASSQLTGSGGVVRQGEMLRELLGKSTQKVIPQTLLSNIPEIESAVLASDDMVAES